MGRSTRRSARVAASHVQFGEESIELNSTNAMVAAKIIDHANSTQANFTQASQDFSGFNKGFYKALLVVSLIETFSLKRGLAKFGEKGEEAAFGEVKQLHQRECFKPIHPDDLTPRERKKVLESLIFLVEKRDGRIKARACANGSVQRAWMHKDDAASPTAAVESILLTSVIDAYEGRKIISVDIPNAFIQTPVDGDKDGDKIVMKMRGPLVDMLEKLDYSLYHDKVVWERKEKVLYLHMKRAIYGMLQSALLFYNKLRTDLEEDGFEINPYDPCVANKTVDGKQLTVVWHVDDLRQAM